MRAIKAGDTVTVSPSMVMTVVSVEGTEATCTYLVAGGQPEIDANDPRNPLGTRNPNNPLGVNAPTEPVSITKEETFDVSMLTIVDAAPYPSIPLNDGRSGLRADDDVRRRDFEDGIPNDALRARGVRNAREINDTRAPNDPHNPRNPNEAHNPNNLNDARNPNNPRNPNDLGNPNHPNNPFGHIDTPTERDLGGNNP